METSSCPISERSKPNPELLPTKLFHGTAQRLYEDTAHTTEHLHTLAEGIHRHYEQTGLATKAPDRAEFLTIRAIWDALQAPLIHSLELDIVQTMLDRLERGEPLQPETRDLSLVPDNKTWLAQSATDWFLGQAEAKKAELENPHHWSNPLWTALATVHPQFCELEFQHRKESARLGDGTYRRNDDPALILTDTVDTFAFTFAPLVACFSREVQREHPEKSVFAQLLAHSESLSWAASVKRSINALPEDISNEKDPLFSFADDAQFWRLPSLHNGPWRVPGFCPGNVVLRPPAREDIVERLFALKEANSGEGPRQIPRPFGSATATELRLLWVAYLAREVESW